MAVRFEDEVLLCYFRPWQRLFCLFLRLVSRPGSHCRSALESLGELIRTVSLAALHKRPILCGSEFVDYWMDKFFLLSAFSALPLLTSRSLIDAPGWAWSVKCDVQTV